MDDDFLLGATIDHVPDVFGANAVNRDLLLERLAGHADRTPLRKELPTRPGRLWWVWTVLDERHTPPKVLRRGRSLTKSRAGYRAEKAYGQELETYHAERQRKALAALAEREQGATS